jgi:hypothetical protein
MFTLTDTAKLTRKSIKIFLILIIGFFTLKILFSIGISLWKKINPPKAPPPNVAFGILPKIIFPEKQKGQINYTLETIGGGLPKFPESLKVYLTPKRNANLLSLEKANQKAQQIGFPDSYEKLTESEYIWKTNTTPETTLQMNIITGNFIYSYDYLADPEVLIQKNLPSDTQAAQEAKSFLQSNGLLASDLATGSAEIKYFKLETPNLVEVPSLSQADFVKVNLFRSNIDGFEILPPDPDNSLINFLFSGNRQRGKRIVKINYNYSPIERNIFATYPLLPIEEAWQKFKNNEGFIASQSSENITIRKIYLAYFEPEEDQEFLQPIYVFKGDQNFLGYYPAISPQWQVQKSAN